MIVAVEDIRIPVERIEIFLSKVNVAKYAGMNFLIPSANHSKMPITERMLQFQMHALHHFIILSSFSVKKFSV